MKIGIDLGGSHIAVGVISEGKVLAKTEKDINFIQYKKEIKELIRDTIVSLINIVLKEANVPIFLIESIGIGIPGIVKANKIKRCSKFNINGWDIAKEIQEEFNIKVKVENDAVCATLAEKEYGKLKDINKGVFLTIGTGIGGANVINGYTVPVEYGHMIIQKDGIKCHCQNKGCFENYCSMRVFKEKVIEILELNEKVSSKEILNLVQNNMENKELSNYIEEYISNFMVGICNIANIINPEIICIGGSFSYFKEILYKKLLEKDEFITYQFDKPKIVLAQNENDSGIIGATLIK